MCTNTMHLLHAFESCHIMALSSTQINVSRITPVLPWNAHSASEGEAAMDSMSVHPNYRFHHLPLHVFVVQCTELSETPAPNRKKHHEKHYGPKHHPNPSTIAKHFSSQAIKKRARKTSHPKAQHPNKTNTSHYQATYWCTSLSGIPLMRANKVKCSRAVKVPMRASNCGQYPIKRRTSACLVMVKLCGFCRWKLGRKLGIL